MICFARNRNWLIFQLFLIHDYEYILELLMLLRGFRAIGRVYALIYRKYPTTNLFLGMFLVFIHGLRTPNEGINQRTLIFWADVADKICFGRT